tara:strand:+ start:3310 stop:3690 length:381 start_codon:yes stop_codon:yes gene_type:complete
MSQIKLKHSDGNSSIIAAPSINPASDVTFRLPNADGSSGQVLKTDGSGNLSFGADTGGKILQHKYVDHGGHVSIAAQTSYPEISSALRFTITPNASNSIIVIKYLLSLGMGSANVATLRICKDVSN